MIFAYLVFASISPGRLGFALPIWEVTEAGKGPYLRGKSIKEGATQQEQVIALIQLRHTPDINSAESKLMGILINSNQNLPYMIWIDTNEPKTEQKITKGFQFFSDKPKPDLFKLCYIWILK